MVTTLEHYLMPSNGPNGISYDWKIPGMGGGGGHLGRTIPEAVTRLAKEIRAKAHPGKITIARYIIGKGYSEARKFTEPQFQEFRDLLSEQELPYIVLEFSNTELNFR